MNVPFATSLPRQLMPRHYAAAGVFGCTLALAVTLLLNTLEARHVIVLFAGVLVLLAA